MSTFKDIIQKNNDGVRQLVKNSPSLGERIEDHPEPYYVWQRKQDFYEHVKNVSNRHLRGTSTLQVLTTQQERHYAMHVYWASCDTVVLVIAPTAQEAFLDEEKYQWLKRSVEVYLEKFFTKK